MWWTHNGNRVLEPKEAILFAESLLDILEEFNLSDDDGYWMNPTMKTSVKCCTEEYIVNEEFYSMASCIVEKTPEKFHAVNIQKLCCVNRITKENSPTERVWKIQNVKMPMALHCPYDWYTTFRSADWADWDEAKKMAMVVDVLMCLRDQDRTGKQK